MPTLFTESTTVMVPERATGRNPSGCGPSPCSHSMRSLRLPVFVRLAWAIPSLGLPLRWRMSRGPCGPADLAVPTALLTLLSKSSCLSTGSSNFRLTEPGIQVGKGTLYGDGAGEPAYGTSSRPSHASVTIPSTIGGNTPGCDAPPILIWVPLAGSEAAGRCLV